MLAVAALGTAALVVAKLVRRFVPEIVVFLLLGVLVGPQGPWSLINEGNIESLRLVTVVALGMIIFLLGDRLRLPDLRHHLGVLLPLNLAQVLLTGAIVFAATTGLGASVRLAFVLAVIAAETGVLTVTATVREERSDGEFTASLLTSVGLTNVLVAAIFGISFPFVLAAGPDVSGPMAMAGAFGQIVVASSLVGLLGGWVLTRFGAAIETSGELLLFVVVVLTGVAGVILTFSGSVVVGTLAAGIYAANRAPWVANRLFASIRTLEAPVYLVFFVVAGAGIHLDELQAVGLLGIAYAVARTAGKVLGAVVGGRSAHPPLPAKRSLHLGLGLLPHAGMAIALVAFVVEQAPTLGEEVSGIVLGSIVMFELAGPLLLRRVLRSSGEATPAPPSPAAVEGPGAIGSTRMLRRVLIPVGSPRIAIPRLPFLFSLVCSMRAELILVHVSRPGSDGDSEPEVLRLIKALADERDIPCRTRHCVSERVARAIAETARDDGADLVIMGEPLRPSLLGAVGWGKTTQRVTELVDVPVLVYPVDPDHPGDVGNWRLTTPESASGTDGGPPAESG